MSTDTSDLELSEFGYTNQLKRTLGSFHTFAAGISYISVLTGSSSSPTWAFPKEGRRTGGRGRWCSAGS